MSEREPDGPARATDGREPLPALRDEEIAGLPAATRVKYQRIGGMIRALAEHPPPLTDLWRQRALAALDAQRRDRVRRIRMRIAAAGLGVAAAAFIIYLTIPSAPATEPSIVAQIVASGEHHLGEAGPGIAYRNDKLVLRATAAQPAEIRVYDERGRLVGRCGDSPGPGCTASGGPKRREYQLELTLQQLGLIRPLLIVGGHIPTSGGTMDQDLDAARGLHVLPVSPIKVL